MHNLDVNICPRSSDSRVDLESLQVNGDSSMVFRALNNLTDSRDSKHSDCDGERDVDSEVLLNSPKSNVHKMVDQFNVKNVDEDMINYNFPEKQNKSFRCTACDKVAWEVNLHPLLKVQVCLDCKNLVESIMKVKVWSILLTNFLFSFSGSLSFSWLLIIPEQSAS